MLLSLPLSLREPARFPGPSSLGILKPGEEIALWSKRQRRESTAPLRVLGIVGKAERGHKQPKLHLCDVYLFYYHFRATTAEISALYSFTVILNLSHTHFPREELCFPLFYQPAPPG